MGIDHGSRYIHMPQQLLYGTDVIATLQQMGGKRVPERMRRRAFANLCRENGGFERARDRTFVQVPAHSFAGLWNFADCRRGKNKLPAKLMTRFRGFSSECVWQRRESHTVRDVLLFERNRSTASPPHSRRFPEPRRLVSWCRPNRWIIPVARWTISNSILRSIRFTSRRPPRLGAASIHRSNSDSTHDRTTDSTHDRTHSWCQHLHQDRHQHLRQDRHQHLRQDRHQHLQTDTPTYRHDSNHDRLCEGLARTRQAAVGQRDAPSAGLLPATAVVGKCWNLGGGAGEASFRGRGLDCFTGGPLRSGWLSCIRD